jgi:2,3-bisphosphoglycerate-independent phosphoglycerate mutase
LDSGGTLLITADHGNAEEMINMETGEIDTEHSKNPVPFIAISAEYQSKAHTLQSGILGDIGPTVLNLMGLETPSTMMGRDLLQELKR